MACLVDCPLARGHYQTMGAQSRQDLLGRDGDQVPTSPHILECARQMLEDPTLFVRSALVPPSYLDRFRHAGVDRFKITDRGSSTATLMATLRAYGTPDLDANLYDVVFKAGSKLKLGLRGLFPDAFIVGLEIPKMSIDGRRFHEVGFIERQPQMSADEQQALASTIVSVDDPPHLRRYLGFIEAVSAKLGWRTSIPRSELAEFDALRSLLDP